MKPDRQEIKINIGQPRNEAKRLWKLGVLEIEWLYPTAPQDRPFTAIGLLVGHLVDSEGRDCFLFRQLNPASGKFLLRSLPVNQIRRIESGASFADVPGTMTQVSDGPTDRSK